MRIEKTSFGGLLLGTSQGNFAVNGGGSMVNMEFGYRVNKQPLQGIILTSEDIRRSRSVSAFANKYRIPVLSMPAILSALREHVERPVSVLPRNPVVFAGISVEFQVLPGEPVILIVRDRAESLGIVADGRITRENAASLLECRTLVFANLQRGSLSPSSFRSCSRKTLRNMLFRILFCGDRRFRRTEPETAREFRRRVKSAGNTPEEILAICADRSSIMMDGCMICRKN